MEEEKEALVGEREREESSDAGGRKKVVKEVEIHLFRQGVGPIAVFKSELGGYEQDQLEVRHILRTHSLKSLFAFNPRSGRGAPIRFSPKTGRSVLPYRHGAVLFIDGEPNASVLKPLSRILLGLILITVMITLVSMDAPEWIGKFNVSGVNFPPLILACVIVVFTRMRKRTRDFLKNLGL